VVTRTATLSWRRYLPAVALFCGGSLVLGDDASDRLGGSLDGIRPVLAARGMAISLDYTGEIFGVVHGGLDRGAEWAGLGNLVFDRADRAGGAMPEVAFHANIYATHGHSISGERAGDAGHLSNIDFPRAVRLFECWLDWAPGGEGWSIRAGQLALDAEFAVVEPAAVFCHSDFGACGAMSANVPLPIFAIATPGIRLRLAHDSWYVQAAVYDGNPDPATFADPSPGAPSGGTSNRHGLTWRFSADEGALTIIETGWQSQSEGGWGAHLGAFYHTDTFSDQRYDRTGRLLADPMADGEPRAHQGDYGFYGVIAGRIGRIANGTAEGFARVAAVPANRNAVGGSWEIGAAATGLWSGRPDDVVALGFAGLEWSRSARGAVADANRWSAMVAPLPDAERVVELTWRIALRPGWTLQPDVQWLWHPGGSAALPDALAVGLRTYLSF
jgi:porin